MAATHPSERNGPLNIALAHTQNPKFISLRHRGCALALPKIPLIEDLTKGPVPQGSSILVEFEPASQWYNASITIAAGWLRSGGKVSYLAHTQPPDEVRERLTTLGLNPETLEKTDQLWITDMYTAGVIGQKSKEKFAVDSLKVADLSIWMGKEVTHEPPAPEFLIIDDNTSILDRFNEEKNWIELTLSRVFPMAKRRHITQLTSILAGGVHSPWAYKQLEAAADGVVDFKLEDRNNEAVNLIRIRSMRKVGFDSKWRVLRMGENFEVTLEK
jgi:KaiC/GvpD/RAD55 family RecA-like ATPase